MEASIRERVACRGVRFYDCPPAWPKRSLCPSETPEPTCPSQQPISSRIAFPMITHTAAVRGKRSLAGITTTAPDGTRKRTQPQ
jgi:hypothetical protein